MIHQIDLILKLYNYIRGLVMTKKKEDIKTSTVKETKDFVHEDIDGVDINDIDMDTFKTVNIPNGNKIVIARNKKSGELQAVRFLVAKEKKV